MPRSADHIRCQRSLPGIAVLGGAIASALLWPGASAQAQQCTTTGTDQTCTNSIFLSGGPRGLLDTGTATVTNTGTGTIFGLSDGTPGVGIRAAAADVSNFGTISGSNAPTLAEGIEVANNAKVTNHGIISGSASTAGFGISATTASVSNFDTISGTAGIAVGITASDTANVTNSNTGTISGTSTGSAGAFNAGSGVGVGANTVNVTNSGTISGISQTPLLAGATGSGISGNTANVTNFGTITGTTASNRGDATGISATAANVSNSGTISGTAGSSFGFDPFFGNGIGIGFGRSGIGTSANVTNSGTISGTGNHGFGITADTVSVTNSGTISGTGITGFGIIAATGSVTNTGTISGSTAALQLSGTSNVFNSGTITGTGGTAIIFGGSLNTLTLAPTSVISGLVSGTGTDIFQLGGAGTGTFDASLLGAGRQYSGFATFNKLAGSNWTLTGNSSFAGATNVNGGILSVNGSLANSTVTVNAGGTLGGNGTVGNTNINGGTLAPGNSIGLLTVQGNLVFTAASSYMVEVSPANADRTNVTGTATLGGATVNANFAAGTYVNKQYTIVNATGGVIGTFNGPVNTNLPGGFKSSLSYDGNDAYLNLVLNLTPNFGNGLNVNQQNLATALTNFFNSTGGIPIVFGALLPAGLTQVSGELPTAAQQTTFDAMNLFMGLLTDPFIAGRGDPVNAGASASQFAEDSAASAYAANGKPRTKSERDAYAAIYRKAPIMADPFTQRWSVWAAGYGGSQTTDGNAVLGSNNTRSSIGGVAVGADYRFSPNTLAGFALAGGGTNFNVNGLGSGRSDLFQAGAFVRHTNGPAYITGALAYGWQNITTDRTVTVAGTDLLHANFNANAYSGRIEGGYRFVTPWLGGIGITPYAAGQFTTFDLPAYAEQAIAGANTFALSYMAKSVTDTRSELGVRSDKSFAMQGGIFTLRGRAAWAHDFDPDRNIGATFQTLPGASFVVNGATHAADSALVTGSAEMKWLNGFSLAGIFEGEFSNVTRSYAGKGVVRYSW